jgi:hypothetical protein
VKQSQKLKIARRKGQGDKLEKYTKRLDELGVKTSSTDKGGGNVIAKVDGPDTPTVEGSSDAQQQQLQQQEAATKLKRLSSAITFSLAAGETQEISIVLRPQHVFPAASDESVEAIEAPIVIHEHRNLDVAFECVISDTSTR